MRLPPTPSTGTSTPARSVNTPGRSWVAPSPNGDNTGSPFLAKNARGSSRRASGDESRAPVPDVSNNSEKTTSATSVLSSKSKPSFLRERRPQDETPVSSNRSVSSQGSYHSRSTFRSKPHGSIISSKLESLEQRIASSGSMGSAADARSEASTNEPQQIDKPKPRFLQRNTSYASMNNESVCSESSFEKPRFLRNHISQPSVENIPQENSSSTLHSSNSNISDDEQVKDELLERLQKEYIAHSEQIETLQQELDKEKKKSRSDLQKTLDEVAALKAELEKEREKSKDASDAINRAKKLENELVQAKQHAIDLEDQATEEVDRLYNELDREKKAAKELEDQATEEVDRLYRELEEEKKAAKQLETQANDEIERLTEALAKATNGESSDANDSSTAELKEEISRLISELEAEKKKSRAELAEMEQKAADTLAQERKLAEEERRKAAEALEDERQKAASLIEEERRDAKDSIEKERRDAKKSMERERRDAKEAMEKERQDTTLKMSALERENVALSAQLEKGDSEDVSKLRNELKQLKQLLKEQEEKSQLIEAVKREANDQCAKLRADLDDKECGANNLKEKIQALNKRCLELENESKEKDACFYSETARLEKELEVLQNRLSRGEYAAALSSPQSPKSVAKLQQEIDALRKKEKGMIGEISTLKSKLEDMSNNCQEPEAIGEIKEKYQSIIVDLEREKDDIETSLHVVKSENNKLKMRIKEEAYGVGAEMVKLLMHEDIDGASIEELEEEFRETFEEPDSTMIEKIGASVKARSPMNITADGKVTVDAQKLALMKQTLIQLKVTNGRTEKQIGFVKGICDQIVESLRQELKDLELEKAEVEKDLLNQISSINNAKAEMEEDLKAKLQVALEKAERGGGCDSRDNVSSGRQLTESINELEKQKRAIEKEMSQTLQERDNEIQRLRDQISKMEKEQPAPGQRSRNTGSQAAAQNSAEIQSEIRDLRQKLEESQEKVTDLRRTASEQKQIISTISADLKTANERIEQDKKIRLERAMEGVEEKMEHIHNLHQQAATSMDVLESMMKQLKARQEMEDREGLASQRLRNDRQTAISLFAKGVEVRQELKTSLQLVELKLVNRLQSLEDDCRPPRAASSAQENEKMLEARDLAATLDEKALQIREESRNALRKVERDITKRLALLEDDADSNEKTMRELKALCEEKERELSEAKSRNKVMSTTASRKLIDQLGSEIRGAVEKIRSKDQTIKSLKVEVSDLQEEIDEILTEKGSKIKKLEEERLDLKRKLKTLEYNYSFSDDEEKELASTEEETSPDRKEKEKNKPSPFYKKVAEKYKETTKTSTGGTPSLGYC